MTRILPLVVITLAILWSSTTYAGIFLNEDEYNAAVGTITRPDYENLSVLDFPLGDTDFFGFFNVTAAGDPSTGPGAATFNSAKNFVFDFDPDGLASVAFTLPEPVKGISGRFSNTFVQDGFRVSTPFDDYDLNPLVPFLSQTFVGITEDELFDTVVFTTSNNIPGNDFVFFNEFAYAAPAAVPEPSTLMTVAFGVGICAFRRRRR